MAEGLAAEFENGFVDMYVTCVTNTQFIEPHWDTA